MLAIKKLTPRKDIVTKSVIGFCDFTPNPDGKDQFNTIKLAL